MSNMRLFAVALIVGAIIGCLGVAGTAEPNTDPAGAPGTHGTHGDPGESMTLKGAAPTVDDRTVVLFDGASWDGWTKVDGSPSQWEVQSDASVMVKSGGNAITKEQFGDFQLHLEFLSPVMEGRTGQGRGNSGVYVHGRYEVQVLGSYGDEPLGNGCGAIYSIAPPMVEASRPSGEWQTYDMVFRAPRMSEEGEVLEHARITVLHNGIVIHNNLELPHTTPGGVARDIAARGPLLLQDHGDPVRYRNIWMRRLD